MIRARKAALITAAATTTLLGLTGCMVDGGGSNWFGNEPKRDDTCAARVLPTPDTVDEQKVAKAGGWGKPVIPEGWRWIVLRLDVVGIARHDDNGTSVVDNRFCLPVDVHLEVFSTEVDTWMSNGPTDDNIPTRTPWVGRVTLVYDPAADGGRFQARPPNYQVRVTATYRPDLDLPTTADPSPPDYVQSPLGIGCRTSVPDPGSGMYGQGSYLGDASVAHAFALFPSQTSVLCDYQGNRFH